MANRHTSKTAAVAPTKQGRFPFTLKFESRAQYERIKRAAAKHQEPNRQQMGRYYPNVTLFLLESVAEKANRVLKGAE